MTDERELLELAAKAVGIEHTGVTEGGAGLLDETGAWDRFWNPLDSAADCEEMEAELEIDIRWTMISVYAERDIGCQAEEAFVDHPSRVMARRWASLQVAADIGKRMK